MRQAVAWGLIPVSPVQAVRPPKPERPHLEVPTADHLVRLVESAPAWSDLDLICDRGDGGAIDPSSFTHAAKRLILRAGLPPATRLHDLSHAFATVLLGRGVHPAIASATWPRPPLTCEDASYAPGGSNPEPAD